MQNNPAAAPSGTSDEIDLLALVGALIDRKGIIIACTVFFAIVGVAYALLATPIYSADAIIQVEEKSAGVGSLLGDSELFATTSAAVTEIELLKSRQVIGQAVDNLKLTIVTEPKLFPVIGSFMHRRFQPSADQPLAGAFLGFASYAWGGEWLDIFQLEVPDSYLGEPLTLTAGENGDFTLYNEDGDVLVSGKVGDAIDQDGFKVQVAELAARPGTDFEVVKQDRLRAILQLQKDISASEKGKDSGILTVSLEHRDPSFAMGVLNEVSRLYVRQNVERKSAEAQQSLEFLTDQLPKVRRDLEQAEDALNAYQASAGSVDITIETQSILNQVVEIEAAISELALKREELQRRFTRDHPAIRR